MRCVVSGMRNAVRCEISCYGDMVIWPALQAQAFALVNIFNCGMEVRSSSFVIPKKCSQLCTPLLARARARQMASGGFLISISGTTNRSEIKESRVFTICMYCTIDYPGICTNNPACSLLAILANWQQWRQFSRL